MVREQSAAADVAEGEIDFVAGPTLDVGERRAERARGFSTSMPNASGVLFDNVAVKGGG